MTTNMTTEEQASALQAAQRGDWRTVYEECLHDANKLGWSDRYSPEVRDAIEAGGAASPDAIIACLPDEADGAIQYDELVYAVSRATEDAMRLNAIKRLEEESDPNGAYSVDEFWRGSLGVRSLGPRFADRDTARRYLLVYHGDQSPTCGSFARVMGD